MGIEGHRETSRDIEGRGIWRFLRFLEVFGSCWRFLEVFGGFWMFLDVFVGFWKFLKVFEGFWMFF